MDRYNEFSIEDFVWDDFFRQWTLSPTPETEALWEHWLDGKPDLLEKVTQAKTLVLSVRPNEPQIDDAEIREVVKRTMGQITNAEAGLKPPPFPQPAPFIRLNTWLRYAASIAIISMLGWSIYIFNKKENSPGLAQQESVFAPDDSFTETINTTAKTIEFALSDGSRIRLAPNGRLLYPQKFEGRRREVHLEGEAFFQVTKDPEHPFLVFSSGLVTKVLGTSFSVKPHGKEGDVTVEVRTGKVSVFAQSEPNLKEKIEDAGFHGMILKPNQRVIYAGNKVRMIKTLVEKPEIVVAKVQIPEFNFEDTPASEVFETLSVAYGIDIIYDAALLKDCPLTARLEGLTLYNKLGIICKAVESSYEIVDEKVIIHSKGCKN